MVRCLLFVSLYLPSHTIISLLIRGYAAHLNPHEDLINVILYYVLYGFLLSFGSIFNVNWLSKLLAVCMSSSENLPTKVTQATSHCWPNHANWHSCYNLSLTLKISRNTHAPNQSGSCSWIPRHIYTNKDTELPFLAS